ncbi:hypothetical protein GCM10009105_09940 [Dokdonella soli]|uniref:Replication-associated protein ORF2/G2P domain-containing protein n=2 Tax=Dokdonella soli TaxID=529810 RepID=A0ABN1IDW0_9GAMM
MQPVARDPSRVDAAQDYAAALSAMDAPFYSLVREKAMNRARAAARSAAAAPGLVPIENKSHGSDFPGPWPLHRAGKTQIDPHARRCKRMRGHVEHSMRLSESQLSRSGGFRFRRLFVTLTYAAVDGWHRKDIAAYLNTARTWAARRKFKLRYTWVAEVQKRGAIHYHVCLWIPARHRLPTADVSGWWPHGWSNLTVVKSGCVGLMAYLRKYLSKMGADESIALPVGARMHGSGGLDREQRREIRYRLAPYWVRDALGTYADIRRTVGGWCDRITGVFIASPWKVEIDRSGLVWAFKPAG